MVVWLPSSDRKWSRWMESEVVHVSIVSGWAWLRPKLSWDTYIIIGWWHLDICICFLVPLSWVEASVTHQLPCNLSSLEPACASTKRRCPRPQCMMPPQPPPTRGNPQRRQSAATGWQSYVKLRLHSCSKVSWLMKMHSLPNITEANF